MYSSTNGYLFDEKRIKSLLLSKVDSIKISINSATRQTYQLVHGVDGFEKVSDNIKLLSELRGSCKLYLSFVATKQTVNEAPILENLFRKYVDDILVVNAITRGSGYIDKQILLGNDEFSFSYPCGQLFNNAVTTAEGYLVACCQDFDKLTVIANLNNVSITDAWRLKEFVDFREKYLKKGFQRYNL